MNFRQDVNKFVGMNLFGIKGDITLLTACRERAIILKVYNLRPIREFCLLRFIGRVWM